MPEEPRPSPASETSLPALVGIILLSPLLLLATLVVVLIPLTAIGVKNIFQLFSPRSQVPKSEP